jgi:hypothetical protein
VSIIKKQRPCTSYYVITGYLLAQLGRAEVVIEVELSVATILAVYVAFAASFVASAGALAFSRDARDRRLLPREVRDRRTGMIIRIGNKEFS